MINAVDLEQCDWCVYWRWKSSCIFFFFQKSISFCKFFWKKFDPESSSCFPKFLHIGRSGRSQQQRNVYGQVMLAWQFSIPTKYGFVFAKAKHGYTKRQSLYSNYKLSSSFGSIFELSSVRRRILGTKGRKVKEVSRLRPPLGSLTARAARVAMEGGVCQIPAGPPDAPGPYILLFADYEAVLGNGHEELLVSSRMQH